MSENGRPSGPGNGMGEFSPDGSTESSNDETGSGGFVSLADIGTNVWILLGSAVIVLMAGILITKNYRKH